MVFVSNGRFDGWQNPARRLFGLRLGVLLPDWPFRPVTLNVIASVPTLTFGDHMFMNRMSGINKAILLRGNRKRMLVVVRVRRGLAGRPGRYTATCLELLLAHMVR